jgi:hypothetical protein
LATQNQDSIVVLSAAKNKKLVKAIDLKPDDFSADIIYKDGTKQKMEFYYGSSYLSQSSRKFLVPADATSVRVTNFKGEKRKIL